MSPAITLLAEEINHYYKAATTPDQLRRGLYAMCLRQNGKAQRIIGGHNLAPLKEILSVESDET